MSKNKDAKRKAKQKAKLAQAAQQEQARIEHIANAVMEICSPLEPDYIDDSQTIDVKGRLILWRLGMIAWNLALVGHKDIPLANLDKMSLDEEHREIVAKAVARLIRRKYELYPNIRFSIENIACPIIAGKPRLKVSIGQQYHTSVFRAMMTNPNRSPRKTSSRYARKPDCPRSSSQRHLTFP